MSGDNKEGRTPLTWLREATHLLAPLTANCRTFHERWAAVRGTAPAGRWSGEWRSESSGHGGPLRCVIEPVNAVLWHATFHAGYARVLRACYGIDLDVTAAGGHWTFRGRSDLGRLGGGIYEYDGEASADTFTASYRSRHDRGVFRLVRENASP